MANETWYDIKFNQQWQGKKLSDLWVELADMFETVLQDTKAAPNDLVRIHIRNDKLDKGDIKVRLRPRAEMTPAVILERIETVQSKSTLAVDDSLAIGIGIIHMPRASGRTHVTRVHGPKNSLVRKRSLVHIVNQDNLCMARAIAVPPSCSLLQARIVQNRKGEVAVTAMHQAEPCHPGIEAPMAPIHLQTSPPSSSMIWETIVRELCLQVETAAAAVAAHTQRASTEPW